jgi:hypothetical protein
MEKRCEERYRLHGHAVYFWNDAQDRCFKAEGITHDVNLHGAFIVGASELPTESTVQVDLVLPGLNGPKSNIRFTGEAHVLRVAGSSGRRRQIRFAALKKDLMRWCMTISQK